MKQADDMGIAQTPTLFINGEEMQGALDTRTLWKVIDRALVSEGITPPANPKPDAPKEAAPKPGN